MTLHDITEKKGVGVAAAVKVFLMGSEKDFSDWCTAPN